ncbi:hypothetical protein DRN69_06875 [Candidatus Pacearchaeota archaeon]|nr:MAG: hypothetical protein DRN69_06875 [Candidatus Pacearchaeota archaeon]
MDFKNKLKRIGSGWYFLVIVSLIYILLVIFKQDLFFSSLNFFYRIMLKIIPILISVFVLMVLINYFITPKFIMKHLREKGFKKWFFVVIGGILSSGPIYMWYPLLADLKSKGLNYGLIACFLYNRAIKIPLIPFAIFYFGWKYIMVLSFVMIFMSIIQGIIINKLMEV